MSADWFCKIGEKKYGPLNDKQLKTIVAKGQLKPEHLVRQGSEGPWIPAGRVKGLFPSSPAGNTPSQGKKPPQATGKPSSKAAAKPATVRATGLPTAAEAPAPPAPDMPQELTLGAHHKHVEMNVDSLNIHAMPVNVSRRKVKTGMKGLKKEEQKKLTILLWCFGGGGITIGLIVFISAIVTGKFSSPKPEETAKVPAADQPAGSGKKTEKEKEKEKDAAEKKPAQEKDIEGTRVQVKITVGDVDVMVLKPMRGPPPEGVKTKDTEVLIVPVRLYLKEGATKPVELTSWFDDSLVAKVSLKDDTKRSYELLGQVADGKTIREKGKPWLIVKLVFEAPADTKWKLLQLKLPAAAFQAGGPIIGFEINPNDIRPDAAKPDKADKSDTAPKSEEGDSAKSDK